MLIFDISAGPPTANEIRAEASRLKKLKKNQFKSGLLADGIHGIILLSLYYFNLLSGSSLLLAVAFSAVIALIITSADNSPLSTITVCIISFIVLVTVVFVFWLNYQVFNSDLSNATISAVMTGSMLICGVIIGRKTKDTLLETEAIGSICDDGIAQQELAMLCRKFPEIDDYRQQALQILRPNITFGELQAMHFWAIDSLHSATIVSPDEPMDT